MLTIEREIASQPEVWRRSAGSAEVAVALARGRDPNFPRHLTRSVVLN